MNIIIIDDELAQLELLEKKINDLSNHKIIGKFTNPHQGLIEISKTEPDLVFLDIAMPGIDGIDLATEIKEALPDTKIIFLTAYDEHAVKAFELQVEDYILKPINDERLLQALNRIESRPDLHRFNEENQPYVCCFNNLHFRDEQFEPYDQHVRWRTSKAREIFAFLLHHRHEFIRKDVLVEQIWPEEDVKQSFAQLYSSIYQIRKTLETISSKIDIQSSENSYKLQLNGTLVDVDIFEKGIENFPFITKDNVEKHKQLLSLYTGDYFGKEDFLWAHNDSQRLQLKYVNHSSRVADFYMFSEDYTNAIIIYLNMQKIMPYQDDIYFQLMKVYHKINDRFAVKDQYEQLEKMLAEEFDEEPSLEITEWYNKVFNNA